MGNKIEESLQEISTSGDIDPNLAIIAAVMDTVKNKNEMVEKFISSNDMKTELSATERTLFSVMAQLALNPFPNMIESSPNADRKLFESEALNSFLREYLKLGIAVKRQGRKEDLSAIQALTEGDDARILTSRNDKRGGGLIG